MAKKLILFLGVILLYLGVSIYRLEDIPPPWHDESIHLNTAKHAAEEGGFWCDFYNSRFKEGRLFISMPLQWVLLGAHIRAFGLSLFGARLLYVSFGLITLCATYLLARRMFNKRTALYSFILLASSHVFLHNSRQLIPQVPEAAFGVISILLFYTASQKGSRLLFASSGISAGLAYLSHPLGAGIFFIVLALCLYNKLSARNTLSFIAGSLIGVLPFIIYILGDIKEYVNQTTVQLEVMYPQQPMWVNVLDEIPQRYFRLPPLKDLFPGVGDGAYLVRLRHMITNLDLRIYLLGVVGPVSYLFSLIWLGLKRGKSGRQRDLFLLALIYAILLSLHPNKFGPYIYVISPFMSICLAVFLEDLTARDLFQRRLSWRGALAVSIAAFLFASNAVFTYKELTTKRVPAYLPFIERVKAYIPRGGHVAGPIYFWIGMNKDYDYVSANEIEYEADRILKCEYGGVRFTELSTEAQGAMVRAILARHKIEYCLITCHNWDTITEGPDLAEGFGNALRRYLFYNAEKMADFLNMNYYPDRVETGDFKDELYYPPRDSIGFYNVSSEYQNSLKIYRIR